MISILDESREGHIWEMMERRVGKRPHGGDAVGAGLETRPYRWDAAEGMETNLTGEKQRRVWKAALRGKSRGG